MNKQKNKKSNHNSRISGENILKYDKAERETSDTNQQENYEDSSKLKNLEKEETNQFSSFNIESLVIIEESITHLIENYRLSELIDFNIFLNYFRALKYYKIINCVKVSYSQKEHELKILTEALNFNVFTIICGFIYSSEHSKNEMNLPLNKIINCLNEIYQIFLMISQIILNDIEKEQMTNIWLNKIQQTVITKSNKRLGRNNLMIYKLLQEKFKIINSSIQEIINLEKNLFKFKVNKENITQPIIALRNINKLSNDWYQKYFEQIFRLKSPKTGIYLIENNLNENSLIEEDKNDIDNSSTFFPIKYPFLDNIKLDYTLSIILDMDETLIHFKNLKENGKGILRMRPGLNEFLDKLLELNCELILFTASTQSYADIIINEIESEKTYFHHKLYRHHTILINNEFVKDISKIGRDLKKVIIIDNSEVNFSLQKENGILIKSFFGDDEDDTSLYNLSYILENIIKKGFIDIRKELHKYKSDIEAKVTSNE